MLRFRRNARNRVQLTSSKRRFAPALEVFERRQLLAANVFIQGTSFVDVNHDGLLGSAEPRVQGATITLYDATRTVQYGQTTTDANGFYTFNDNNVIDPSTGLNDLKPGRSYVVVQTPPGAYQSSGTQIQSQVYPATSVSVNAIQVTPIDPTEITATYRGATTPYDRLRVNLFNDLNGNGIQETGELSNPSFPSFVTPTKWQFSLSGNGVAPDPVATQFDTFCVDLTTDVGTDVVNPTPISTLPANGGKIAYLYNHYGTSLDQTSSLPASLQSLSLKARTSGLQIAIWTLEYGSKFQVLSHDLARTSAQDYADLLAARDFFLVDATGKNEQALNLDTVLPTRQNILAKASLNFANVAAPAALGDRVWHDSNANGQQDSGELGISGVTVKLRDSSGNVIATTTTDSNGLYGFTNLVPGTYSVAFVAPAGYTFTSANNGNDASDSDADPSTGLTGGYTLVGGQTDNTVDAGLYQFAALGDRVWLDSNANGQQDSGEAGISGVTVHLRDSSGNVVDTTTTDGNGLYSFAGLVPGTYSVAFVAPTGHVFTTANSGNDVSDSDVDPSTGITGSYTLVSGQTDITVDAGLYQLAALGDRVWLDSNANGQQDSGEAGISGVTVNLRDSSGNVVATTTTNGSGIYSFTGLVPGTYSVAFFAPTGYLFTTANSGNDASDSDANTSTGLTGDYTLVSGQTDNTVDAGLYRLAALGDRVWLDSNANGQQDSGELGISGVTVNLRDGSGNVVGTAITDGNGLYSFTGLVPGIYSVAFVAPAGYITTAANIGNDGSDSDADPSNGLTGDYTLVSGQTDNTVDAGFYQLAALGDRVWLDSNANGQQDSGELGISGVTVNLRDSSGNVINTAITDSNGLYSFTGLIPGTYSVTFVAPTGYVFTTANSGNDASDSDANTSTGLTGDYTLVSGQTDNTVDAGLYRLAALGDRVWLDTNANGQQDSGEVGISGVTVKLRDSGGNVINSTTTDGNGLYSFTNLVPGTYSVAFVAPTGYVFTTANSGNDASDSDADPSTGLTGGYTLVSGQTDNTIDAGLYQLAALGDRVWLDSNANGQQDSGEAGISGVTVNLRDSSGNVVATTTTNGSGIYSFTGLVPGTYSVAFFAPTGYLFTTANSGNDASDSDANPSTGLTGGYTLVSGQTDNTVDAGLYQLAALGDRVWLDSNANGQQDGGEAGISGVTVKLRDSSGSVINTTITDGDGFYSFTNLVPGTYSVAFVSPTGYVFTTANSGNDASDSDANTSTGLTGGYTLVSGQTDNTVDAGLYQLAALGDRVWLDSNANGQQDSGELGISGVTVKLRNGSGTEIATTTTNGSGIYSFTGLVPGTYSIAFFAPTGYVFTGANAGNDVSDSDANTSTGLTGGYTLVSGQTDNTVDAGLYRLAALGDRVWLDTNTNGQQESGELGISGVTVKLRDSSGTVVDTTTTNSTGLYSFTGLVPGTYSVAFFAPTGYLFTTANSGNDSSDSDANASTGLTGGYTLVSGQTDNTVDAGLYRPVVPGSISGTKYHDLTGNGLTDDDAPLKNVKIYIDTNHNNSFDDGEVWTTTAADGTYRFNGLTAGSYTVREVVPKGWIRTGPVLTDEYVVVVTAGNNSGGNDFANAEVGCECQISNIVYIINGCRQVSDLRGNVNPGDTVTAKFTVRNASASNPATFSLVSYTAPGSSFVASQAYKQEVFDMVTTTYTSNGTYSLNVEVPDSYFQVDFVCGEVIDRFGPDGSNIFYTPQGRLFSADNGGCKPYSNALGTDDIGTVAFWSSDAGQSLIKCLNGSSTSLQLGNWLASNFGNLYGSLAGKTNAQVAAHFKTLKASSSTALEAQVMATALSIYVTDVDLAGMAGYKSGFNISYLGIAQKQYNVGTRGSTIGLSNTKQSIWTIVKAANNYSTNGKVVSSNRSNLTTLFTNLNATGALDS